MKKVRVTIAREKDTCFLLLPFDPVEVFGKVRVPVVVTLNGYTYRSTIASDRDGPRIPLARRHREAAGLSGDETLTVTIALEELPAPEPPAELIAALSAAALVWKRWCALSHTRQRELIERVVKAKRPEVRAQRIEETVRMVAERTRSIRAGFTPFETLQSTRSGRRR